MNETKYISIASEIEYAIKNGYYADRLPPVRSLSGELSVSVRTMNKALKILITKGLIVPKGARGISIVKKRVIRPNTGVVGIYSKSEEVAGGERPLLPMLAKLAEEDGFEPLFLQSKEPQRLFVDEKIALKGDLGVRPRSSRKTEREKELTF